eukprot:3449683-Pyramimonas_sp.AAC.1
MLRMSTLIQGGMDECGKTASPVPIASAEGVAGREEHPLCVIQRGVEERPADRAERAAREAPPLPPR